jgi:hypothetical protein
MFFIIILTVILGGIGKIVYEKIPSHFHSWRYWIAATIGAVIMFIDCTFILLQHK